MRASYRAGPAVLLLHVARRDRIPSCLLCGSLLRLLSNAPFITDRWYRTILAARKFNPERILQKIDERWPINDETCVAYTGRTFVACSPFSPLTTSNSTVWPCSSVR